MLGINLDLITEMQKGVKSGVKAYFTRYDELSAMIKQMNQKSSEVLQVIRYLTENSDPLLNALIKGGYLKESEKKAVVKEIAGLEKDLQAIYDLIGSLDNIRSDQKTKETVKIGHDIVIGIKLFQIYKRMQKRLDTIDENISKVLKIINSGHSIEEMLNAIAGEGKGYDGLDMLLYPVDANGKTIKVNISAAVRIYQKGLSIVAEKEEILQSYEETIQRELIDDYEKRRRILISKIHHIEANPKSYQALLISEYEVYLGDEGSLQRIDVREQITSLNMPSVESFLQPIQSAIKEETKLIKKSRTSIEELFAEDKKIAALFDFR